MLFRSRAFGIGRRTKTSYRLREGNRAVAGLSLVIREAGLGIVGTVSFWPLRIGAAGTPALLLGPLAVHPERQNLGIGLALMREGLARARAMGHRLVILVGDEPYYARAGFRRLPPLLKTLRDGMSHAGVPVDKQDEHVRLLNNALAAAFTAKTAAIPRERLDELMDQLETLEALLPEDVSGDSEVDEIGRAHV